MEFLLVQEVFIDLTIAVRCMSMSTLQWIISELATEYCDYGDFFDMNNEIFCV